MPIVSRRAILAALCLWPVSPGLAADRVTPLSVPEGGKPGFSLVDPAAAGIRFTNEVSIARIVENNNLMNGCGVAAGDYDGDGRVDLYFCSVGRKNGLFRNLGNWRFEDCTAAAGVVCANQASTGAAFVDVNGDGRLDLLVTSCGGPNACFLNLGGGRFTNLTEQAGLLAKTGSTSMALGDVDGDGDLDLFIANYGENTIRSGIAFSTRKVNGRDVVTGRYANRLKILNGKIIEVGEPAYFGLNDGSGRFAPVPYNSGAFSDHAGNPLRGALWDLGLSAIFRDLNGDLRPDLYVCNDFSTPDRIWLNQGGGRFKPLPLEALGLTSHFSMAVDTADINRDGLVDFFVADMMRRSHRSEMQAAPVDPITPLPEEWETRIQRRQNVLALNRGDGTYADIAQLAGLAATDWTWSAVFLDVDLDGYEDLLIANGHVYDTEDQDTQNRFATMEQSRAQTKTNLLVYPRLTPPNTIWRNNGDLTFKEVGEEWGFSSTQVCHGMCLADLDNDGDQDVIINTWGSAPLLYRNNAPTPRVAVRLAGRGRNTRGIGAKIELVSSGVKQSQEMIAGGRYLSSDDPMRVFAALGGEMTLNVYWPSGKRSQIAGIKANTLYEIQEPESGAVEAPKATPAKPLFEEVKTAYVDEGKAMGDFASQPLLSEAFSDLGPKVEWKDINGDGKLDLIVRGSSGASVLLNPAFAATPFNGAKSAARDMADIDADGKLDWFSAEGFVPGHFPEAAKSELRLGRGGSETFEDFGAVSDFVFAAMNGDKQPDLLLACEWGTPRVLLNQGGKLRDATKELGLDRFRGCWNGVATADFDKDGRIDFVASNLGRNHRWQSRRGKPIRIYFGDLDGNGVVDVIESFYDSESKRYVPAAHLSKLAKAIPTLAQRFPTFAKYSEAGIDEVLGDAASKMRMLEANWFESTLFLNRGDHFEARPLPVEAQFAPGFGIAVADFNADGSPDLFLAQNRSAVAEELAPMNNGRGLILLGDGRGGFRALSTSESGISIAGDQRGCAAADFDGDGKIDLAVGVNGGPLRLYRNRQE